MKRAAIYCRMSRDLAGSRLGVLRQEEDCRALAERRGWQVIEVFVDNDISAFAGKPRPEYQRMLSLVLGGEFDAIVAWHPDRLHRQPKELEEFIAIVGGSGVVVATARAGDFDLNTAAGRLTARISGAVARNESEHRGDRLRRAAQQRSEAGLHATGEAPYGYRRLGQGRLAVDEERAEVVRHAAARLLAGETIGAVVEDLNERGSRNSKGNAWTSTTLWRTLVNPRLAGWAVSGGLVVGAAEWPPILEDADQKSLIRIRERSTQQTMVKRRYCSLLTGGLAVCAICGRPLIRGQHARNRKPFYYGGRQCRHIYYCDMAATDAHVVKAVMRRIRRGGSPKAVNRERDEAELADVRERLSELAVLFGNGTIDRSEWLRARHAPATRHDLLTERLDAPRASTYAPEIDPGEWDALPFEHQRACVVRHVARVVISAVAPDATSGMFDVRRVKIRWRR